MVTDHNGRDEAPSQRGLSPKKGITRQNISAKTQLLITAKLFWPIKFSAQGAVCKGHSHNLFSTEYVIVFQ